MKRIIQAMPSAEHSGPNRHLFTYGTLMRGELNHHFLERALYLGPAETEPGFELANLGAFPALVASGRGVVVGEVFEVEAQMLAELDRFEQVPALYQRRVIRVVGPHCGDLLAETYLMSPVAVAGCPRITSGSWRRR